MNGQNDLLEPFFSSVGRTARVRFLIAVVVLVALGAVYEAIAHEALLWLTGWFVYPALIFSGACVASKRLHDRGRSGWWAFIILVALVALWPHPDGFFDFPFMLVMIWAMVDLGLLSGEPGPNRYGQPPLRAVQA